MEAEVGDLIKHTFLKDVAYITKIERGIFAVQRLGKEDLDHYNTSDFCTNWRLANNGTDGRFIAKKTTSSGSVKVSLR